MFFRMLKKDLKKKKTMNLILLLFIILASMFLASGMNNVVTVMNGTDDYLNKAGVGDFIIITMGDDVIGSLDGVLEEEKEIKSYRLENVFYGSEDNVKTLSGEKLETKNTTVFQSIEGSKIKFFGTDNEEIKTVEKGHVYVSGNFLEKNGLKAGDQIRVVHESIDITLTIDGKVKDALLGSDFMGNTRFILNEEDYRNFLKDENIALHYQGQIAYVDTDNESAVSSALSDCSGVSFAKGRSVIKMCYVMDLIVAFVTLILSVCLIIVSFVVLRFSIHFTIAEEFREIGVMKAIGIRNVKIRSMYVLKYFFMAVVGAVIGFAFSIPFGNMLIKSVSENMLLENDMGYGINAMGAILVVCASVLFAYLCTGKVKKSSPLDAIRSGQTGERYKKKKGYRLSKSHTGNCMYLAINDVLSSPKRFLTIIVAFSVCTLLVLMIVNTTSTMNSPNLISAFTTKSDLYVTNVKELMNYMSSYSKEEVKEDLEKKAEQLTKEGMPSRISLEIQYSYPVTFEGKKYNLSFQQGIGTKASDYEYTEGLAPQAENEIAITPAISRLTGAKIGDTLTVHFKDQDVNCMVTAYFDTMNLLGEVVRLHEDAPTDMGNCSSALSYQIYFTDNVGEKTIEDRKEKIKTLYDNDKVMTATEYCVDCIGVVDTMEAVQYLLLGITFVVVILVTILMERTFIAGEVSQIAILKAIGFKDSAIIKWHMYRFGIVSVVAVILAGILSIPMTRLCITPIFSMMGASHIKYNLDVLKLFVIYPGSIIAVNLLFTFLTALCTKKIHASDTSNIE